MNIEMKNGFYTVLVVGCGGTGSQLLSPLFQLCNNLKKKINKVILIDGDIVESKNLQNQRCMTEDIGYNKAYVMSRRYGYVFPDLSIETYENYITTIEQLDTLVGCYSNLIMIGCVDNNATRKLLNEYFTLTNDFSNLIYIDSGNGTAVRNGQIVVGYKKGYDIHLAPVGEVFDDILNTDEKIEHVGTCMRVTHEHPQNISTNMFAASLIFNTLTNVLMFNKIEGHLLFFNANSSVVYSR